jgi:hypothetical protein
MKLPAGLGTLDWSDWIRGLWGAAVGGGAGAIGASSSMAIIDPAYVASHGAGFIIKLMGGAFAVNAFIGAALFLAKKPIPDPIKTTEVTVETTTVGAKLPVVVETMKETTVSTEPAKDPAKP